MPTHPDFTTLDRHVLRVAHGSLLDNPLDPAPGSQVWVASIWPDQQQPGGWGRLVWDRHPSGRGWAIQDTPSGIPVGVLNLQGQVFMANTDSPFRVGDQALLEMKAKRPDLKVVLVDIHAEATSEKQAIGWWFDGRASLVIGTHTHVPTADARILPKGTAYQGDAGMTGAYEGIIGFDPKAILEKFLYQTPRSMETATRDVRMCGAIVDVDEATGKARAITSIQEKLAG